MLALQQSLMTQRPWTKPRKRVGAATWGPSFGDQLECRPHTEDDTMRFIWHLREENKIASSTLCTMYSVVNGVWLDRLWCA